MRIVANYCLLYVDTYLLIAVESIGISADFGVGSSNHCPFRPLTDAAENTTNAAATVPSIYIYRYVPHTSAVL